MRNAIRMTATALAVMFLASGAAYAAEPTALEKAELAQLSPQVRGQVQARLKGDQTVHGILKTILLNNISALYASNRIIAVDFDEGVAVAEGKDGQSKMFPFDVTTLVIRK